MKIYEFVEKTECNKIVKHFVDERDNVPDEVDFLIKAEDPARELLKYCVYQLNADNYRECIENITNDQFSYKALLNYFENLDESIFMKITIYDYDDDNPLVYVKDNVRPSSSNYIIASDLPDNPITDIFLDVLELEGWWTPDSYYYFSDDFDEDSVSKLKLRDY